MAAFAHGVLWGLPSCDPRSLDALVSAIPGLSGLLLARDMRVGVSGDNCSSMGMRAPSFSEAALSLLARRYVFTSALILFAPLLIELDREQVSGLGCFALLDCREAARNARLSLFARSQAITEFEQQQLGVLTTPAGASK